MELEFELQGGTGKTVDEGRGLAVCDHLGVIVLSMLNNTLRVFSLWSPWNHFSILGGAKSPAPMQFNFMGRGCGYLAFTGSRAARYLLVTDAGGGGSVHVIDVVHGTHVGYVAAPGTIAGPRGVAARGELVAVSAWEKRGSGKHIIQLFRGSGSRWTPVHVLGGGPGRANGKLQGPMGLRFSASGDAVVVAEFYNDRVSMFCVEDGSFVRHVVVADLFFPEDVEVWDDGWLMTCHGFWSTVKFVNGSGVVVLNKGFRDLITLDTVDGLGLLVRDRFVLYKFAAKMAMRAHRVAWMVAVARGIMCRSRILS